MEESVLVLQLKSGSREAFSELYDRYATNLYHVILKLVNSESDAENLLQDTFVKIWRSIDSYDPKISRLYTWLITIARNMAIDYCRSAYFSKKKSIQNDEVLVYKETPRSEMCRLDYIGMDDVLNRLDQNLRQLIDLQFYLGYTQQEVADELNIPLGTVKSRTRTAFKILKEQLQDLRQ